MKKTIRKGCFETNSSSMHSIVVTNETGENCFEFDNWNPTECTLYGDDVMFGRSPFEILNTVYDKARYAIADAGSNEEKVDSIIALVKEISGVDIKVRKRHECEYHDKDGNRYWDFQVEWVTDPEDPGMEYPVLSKEKDLSPDKQTQLEFKEWEEYPGYVDHQSQGLLDRFFAKEGITMKDFLLNKRYFVIIDGDEYCVFDDMCKTGIIDQRKIDHIVF